VAELEQARALHGDPPFTKEELTNLTEKVGELLIIQAATGEQVFEAVLRCVDSNEFGIIIVDSITNVLPEANAERDLVDANKIAARASLVTDFVSLYTPMTNRFGTPHRTTLIGIGQARAKQNRQTYEKEWNTPAAWAWKHAVQQRVLLWNGQKMWKQHQGVKAVQGKEVVWQMSKGKAGAHEHTTGKFDFYFDDVFPDLGFPYGADRCDTLLTQGMSAGLIREAGGKVFVVDSAGEFIASDVPGLPVLKQMMEADFEFELLIRQHLMASKGIECLFREG
jgi:hypothetical protein